MAAPIKHLEKLKPWREKDGLIKIEGWARDGLNDGEIAKNIGVSVRTYWLWKSKYPEIREAGSKVREIVDREIEHALYKGALGYEVEDIETTIEKLPDGETKTKVKKLKRWVPPSPPLVIFYLKNRKPNEWRDRLEFEMSGTVGLVQIIDDIPKKKIIEGEVVNEQSPTRSDKKLN